jgi:heterodisulfide reductase subunit A2
MLAKEHSTDGLDTAIFYMDVRTHGKDFERYYNRGRDVSGIRFVKSRITNVVPVEDTAKPADPLCGFRRQAGGRKIRYRGPVRGLGRQAVRPACLPNASIFATDSYGFARTSGFDPVRKVPCPAFMCAAGLKPPWIFPPRWWNHPPRPAPPAAA